MLNSETTDKLLDLFGGWAVVVEAESCLNRRHKDAGCELCVQGCPAAAIELHEQQPVLDEDRCVRCGVCLHVCPVDVFSQHRPAERTLLQVVGDRPERALGLVCSWHPTPDRSPAAVEAVVRHRRCLAALTADQLLNLSQDGERVLWLDDTPCATCPIGQAQATLARTVGIAQRLLQAFGRRPSIYLLSTWEDARQQEPAVRPVVEGWQPQLSRRGFFGAFKRLVSEVDLAEEEGEEGSKGPGAPITQRLPHRVPRERRRLLQRLRQWETPAKEAVKTEGLSYTDVQVDTSLCSACALCAAFCPTAAIGFVEEGSHFVLSFQPSICIDCGICAAACPEDAVQFVHELPVAALASEDHWLLVAGELTTCQTCQAKTALRPGESGVAQCYVCRMAATRAQALGGERGLLGDLWQARQAGSVGELAG